MQIKQIHLMQLQSLYDEHLTRDFPANELRSYENMRNLCRIGQYKVFGYYKIHQLLAYACLAVCPQHQYYLLDYFAVIPEYRSQKIGNQELTKNLDANGLIIEVETPSYANSPEEEQLCLRRIDFYIKNGATLSRISGELFHVHFTLLYLPIQIKIHQEQLLHSTQLLYQTLLPKHLYQQFVHLSIS